MVVYQGVLKLELALRNPAIMDHSQVLLGMLLEHSTYSWDNKARRSLTGWWEATACSICWKGSKNMWMWQLGAWSAVRLDDLWGLIQRTDQYNCVILTSVPHVPDSSVLPWLGAAGEQWMSALPCLFLRYISLCSLPEWHPCLFWDKNHDSYKNLAKIPFDRDQSLSLLWCQGLLSLWGKPGAHLELQWFRGKYLGLFYDCCVQNRASLPLLSDDPKRQGWTGLGTGQCTQQRTGAVSGVKRADKQWIRHCERFICTELPTPL